MEEKARNTVYGPKDVTEDFLLCNRCGTCRAVCPVFLVLREEGASARGKVELAEAFFRGAEIDEKKLQQVFDLCLHCMTCEENCPSGMRAGEIVTAVRAEMAKRGLIPRPKRFALRLLERMDNALFRAMRALGIVRRAPLHGVGGKSPLRVFFPLLGWPRERFVPLPKDRPFLGTAPELFAAKDAAFTLPDPDEVRRVAARSGSLDPVKAADLVGRIAVARERNLSEQRRVYFFVGHSVNHFFPEEAEAVVKILTLLGTDVLVPHDQVCCGAPAYYAGDITMARRSAAETLERLASRRYDWIVTSCSSGGLMLKEEFPRLFDLTENGFFKIEWDREMETFRRLPSASPARKEYPRAADLYNQYVRDRVYDVNELLASILGYHEEVHGLDLLFGGREREPEISLLPGGEMESEGPPVVNKARERKSDNMPVVTYHHPCHLKRGQDVSWQPVAILKALPGHRYVAMEEADRCCGGGGAFTFAHADESEEIAREKLDAIGEVLPDIVATSCPVCRMQLMDMLHRRFVLHAKERGEEPRRIPVRTPVELLLEDIEPVLEGARM
jgi:glycolate oxidase iron-sulfur subunit